MLDQPVFRGALPAAAAILSAFFTSTALAVETVQQPSKAETPADLPASERRAWRQESRDALNRVLARRIDHGLDRVRFLANAPHGEKADARAARYQRAALAYAGALAHGQVDPASLHDIYTLARPDPDLPGDLRAALATGRLERWLAGLAPQDDDYRRLSEAYLSFRDTADMMQAPRPIRASGPIRVGDRDARVGEITQQLVDEDYLPVKPATLDHSDPLTYTQRIADAVTALQRDYGIAADGVVGRDTLGVLNMGPGDRARALAVALERLRWLPRMPPATRIDVHTASARLRYWRNGELVDERRVIVGKPGNETPMLGSPIYRLVANPTWTIPKSIEKGEMANVGSAYLQAHNMERRGGWIVQQPGPENALGLVKFDMRNRHAIYLHDTSSPALFDRSLRYLSHGCVRVSDALGFATMLAEQEGVGEQWRAARDSGQKTFVPLPREIPVRLIYGNVLVGGDGRIVFRTDPYGWNEPVAKALGFLGESAKPAKAQTIDIGP